MAYTFGIVGNHPFVDGNKRTGFICGILFLETNGYRFNAKEEDAAQAIMQLAARQHSMNPVTPHFPAGPC